MTALLRHRGPDDEGYLFAGPDGVTCASGPDTPPSSGPSSSSSRRPVRPLAETPVPSNAWLALGHRRLSILDLSPGGHQPMSWQDRYWIVYNGEVYNCVELRSELEAAGCRFSSHSDTEVILAAYAHWGTDCLSRFNGMWAFLLLDQARQRLLLARDRYGVKPLYFWPQPAFLAFASEIKAFTALPSWRARLNGQAAHDFLLSGVQDHSAETLFEGVFQLEPGCCAIVDGSQRHRGAEPFQRTSLKIERWYHLTPRPFEGTFDEATEQLRELLIDSVRLRLRSDVPVGSCLSGGVDSSAIVCAASRLLRAESSPAVQKTFSACSEIERFDERPYIEKVVAAARPAPTYVFPSLEALSRDLDTLLWHQDEPFASTSIFAQWAVFGRAGEERMKVMLDGQGADELLCGYPNFRRAFLAGLIHSGKPGLAWREARAMRPGFGGALSLVSRAWVDAAVPAGGQQLFRHWRKNRRPPAWLNPERLGASYPGRLAHRFQRPCGARELSLELMTGAHLQMLLHWEDRNSMAHGVEARLPFLDYRLAEFALGLPDEFKIRDAWTKAVLRSSLEGLVPAEVLRRRDKMGFVTPEEVWARQAGGALFRRWLAESLAASQGILQPAGAVWLERVLSGQVAYDGALWRMICFGRWLLRFGVSL